MQPAWPLCWQPCCYCLQVVEFMHNNMHSYGNLHYKAFYSSEIGGIVTEPPLMVLPIDDHMVS